jgi:hypothetical protein
MKIPYEEFDLSGVHTYPLASRKSKARVEDFARPYTRGSGMSGWLESLPAALAAGDFKAIVRALADARRRDAAIVWGIGAHVLKTGLSPILIDLMERGFVSALATNGAVIIHDFEIALGGATSEDVDEALGPGRFGMAEETATLLNDAITAGVAEGLGIGQAVGRFVAQQSAACAAQPRGHRMAARHSAHDARGDRNGHHSHAPTRVGCGTRRGQPARLPLLRFRSRAAREWCVFELGLGGYPA